MYGIRLRQLIQTAKRIHINYNSCELPRNFSINKLNFQNITFNSVHSKTYYRKFENNLRRSFTTENETFLSLQNVFKQEGRIYASTILNILENSTTELIQNDRELILLQCCGHILPDQSLSERSTLADKVWKKLEECGINFTVNHYNTYLQIGIENRIKVDFKEFLSKMKCEPNEETYRLLLDCICQAGDVSQSVKIVEEMKSKNFPADERLFNALILSHAIKGGLTDAKKVLETMQSARIALTPATYFAIIRGIAERQNRQEFVQVLEMYPGAISEQEFLQLLFSLGIKENYLWSKEAKKKLGIEKLSKVGLIQLDLLCIQLIHMKKPDASIFYYKMFVDAISSTENDEDYAGFLLEEMLHSRIPTQQIIRIAKDLQELNSFALQQITGVSIKLKLYDVALEMFEALPSLRPHYFWPLLLNASKHNREIGVLNILKKMLEWNVQPDTDTLQFYCLPFCDLSDPKNFLARLQSLGFSVRELLTPTLAFLIKENRIVPALKLYATHKQVLIQSERLLNPLVIAWTKTKDTKSITDMLSKINMSVTSDYNGQFLLRCLRMCPTNASHMHFLNLVKEMQLQSLKISIGIGDTLVNQLKLPKHRCTMNTEIQETIDTLINASVNHTTNHIKNPKHMNVTELECHLIELQNKNMETRGILRRLIQEYCRLGNEQRVNELRQQFINSGYHETPGMKAGLLQIYTDTNNVKSALSIYGELKQTSPEFIIDDFKILGLATMLVTNNQFNLALEVLSEHKHVRGGPSLERNCWNLLKTAENETQIEQLFELLIAKGFCVPSNIILGPLVRIHLIKGNLDAAVKVYTECVEKHNCTPLRVELLSDLVKNRQDELIQNVLNVTIKIHGSDVTTSSLIAAFAQNGLSNSVRKVLNEVKDVSKKEIENMCKYWVYENNLLPLETLSNAILELPYNLLDRPFIYNSIMQLHCNNNDCESAMKFYEQLLLKEERIPQKLVDELLKLTRRCNYEIPQNFSLQNRNL